MKIGTVTSSISRNAGGLFNSVRSLSGSLSRSQAVEISVHGIEDSFASEDITAWAHLKVKVHRRGGMFRELLAQTPELFPALIEGNYDLLHTHGKCQWPSVAVSKWHAATGRPYIVSPRGMLDSWATEQSSLKKKIAGALFENRHLNGAACLHALCSSEAESIREFGINSPICVIPNGIDLPTERSDGKNDLHGRNLLLFLGRLHPKKGLTNALRAWAHHSATRAQSTSISDWQFVVAGWDQCGHEAELKRLCVELGLTYVDIPAADFTRVSGSFCQDPAYLAESRGRVSPTVIFTGPAFGDTKDELLSQASAFVLPSFSEGLPMSVLEAWSYRLPVLMTEHCNIPEGFAANAAIRIGTDVESIAAGLSKLLGSTAFDLKLLGSNGRALVENKFTWPMIATQMMEVYDWILGRAATPRSVILSRA